MAVLVHINGLPSTGKSFGVKALDPKTTFVIDADLKGLSWTGWKKDYNPESKNYIRTSDIPQMFKILKGINDNAPHIKVIVLDTITGALTDKVMGEMKRPGYDKWRDLASDAYELYDYIRTMRDDLIVYVMAHVTMIREERPDGTAITRYTTKYPGQKLTSLSMNSKLNYILYTKVTDEGEGVIKYQFVTQNDGTTEARSSYGVLPLYMDNDLEEVRKLITEAEFV